MGNMNKIGQPEGNFLQMIDSKKNMLVLTFLSGYKILKDIAKTRSALNSTSNGFQLLVQESITCTYIVFF